MEASDSNPPSCKLLSAPSFTTRVCLYSLVSGSPVHCTMQMRKGHQCATLTYERVKMPKVLDAELQPLI